MGKIFAVANQKGGVGKSTTVVNLGAYFGSRDYKVLCIDIDPQGNTTTGLGIKKKNISLSSYDVLIGKARIQEAIVHTEFKNVSILPATEDLAGGELELANIDNRVNRLKMQLLTCRLDYDYIFIDCPPALGLITLNGLVACDKIIVPMLAEFFALEGLAQLINTIKIVKSNYNPSIDIEGILFTMFDSRNNLSADVVANVKENLDIPLFDTIIPRNVRLAEAPSYGIPIIDYDNRSTGAASYRYLAKELIKRDQN
jgi:chromosome partitioning protein